MTRLPSMFIILLLFGFTWIGYAPSVKSEGNGGSGESNLTSNKKSDLTTLEFDTNDRDVSERKEEISRSKRNVLLGNNGLNGPTSVEGLLSSCQLTNLLLYQLLNQRLSGAAEASGILPNNLLQPFPAGAAGLAGLAGPLNVFKPVLQTTYTTTSTYLTQMTATSIHTITLLFGNKESLTSVTQTKLINATTSTVLTLTSTIQPTPASSLEILPISTAPPVPVIPTKYVEEVPNEIIQNNPLQLQQETVLKTSTYNDLHYEQPKSKPARRQKHGRNRKFARDKSGENYGRSETEQPQPNSSPSYKYGDALNFSPKKRQQNYAPELQQADEDYYYQKENDRNYYVRRLKRRGEVDESEPRTGLSSLEDYDNLEREYLLEPSSDASFLDNVAVQACPMPKEITVTKTVTKFVNRASTLPFNVEGNRDSRQDQSSRLATRSFGTDSDNFEAAILTGSSEGDIPGRSVRRFVSNSAPSSGYKQRLTPAKNNGYAVSTEINKDNPITHAPRRQGGDDIIRSINESRRSSRHRSGSNPDNNSRRILQSRSGDFERNDDSTRSRFTRRLA